MSGKMADIQEQQVTPHTVTCPTTTTTTTTTTPEDAGLWQNENSLSPARPSISPDLPEKTENGETDLFSRDMEEEEIKLEEANRMEEERMRNRRKEEEKEITREQRYKRLMHLLEKSQFYSQFLFQQIESQRKISVKSSQSDQSEETSSQPNALSQESQSSSGSSSGGNKRKKKESTRGRKRHKKDTYNITDVIDEDTVKKHAEGSSARAGEGVIQRVDQPKLFENGSLRPYQVDGFSWLMTLYENGVNGILGDEMGLGKTVQFIALVCHLVEQGVGGPFLVCAPLSTLPNWVAEFKRFAPKIPTLLYHGSEHVRAEKRKQINKDVYLRECTQPVRPVVITSYEVVIRDTRVLQQYRWRYMCVDEGHRLKNHQCRLTKCLNTLPSTNRLLLTGTPLQNSLAELWALLNFLMPDIFDSLGVFESWFDVTEMQLESSDQRILQQEREGQVISTLMKILSPFFLRRMKENVDLNLPAKRELLVYTPMTPVQLTLYTATLTHDNTVFSAMKQNNNKEEEEEVTQYDARGRPKRRTRGQVDFSIILKEKEEDQQEEEEEESLRQFFLAGVTGKENKQSVPTIKKSHLRVKLQNRMMQLRRVVNHPYLVNYPLNPDQTLKVDEQLVECCGKLQVLDQLLGELHRRRHRVLLFSQMTTLLDIVEDYLTLRPHYRYRRLDGQCNLDERQKDIQEFNARDSDDFLFLLSTRAGGLGVNLASADTVIIYDSDWNPQCDLQAQDRCHRIGQTLPVLVLRLITASSIDERIVERAANKRKLEKLIIQSGKFQAPSLNERSFQKVMNDEELLDLLRERDYEREHRASKGHVFTKEELDQLLDRSDLTPAGMRKKKKKKQEEEEKQLKGVFKVILEEH